MKKKKFDIKKMNLCIIIWLVIVKLSFEQTPKIFVTLKTYLTGNPLTYSEVDSIW